MAASKGKPFPFKHVWSILQTFDKWKLRDQETAPKKSAMLRMDDSEDEEERNVGKPEGNKKGKAKGEDGRRGVKPKGEDGPHDEGKRGIDNEDIGDEASYHREEEKRSSLHKLKQSVKKQSARPSWRRG